MKPYPIFLTGLDHRHCIVIGGGGEAEGRVRGLLDVDATITVIAPTLNFQMAEWANEARFTWIPREYEEGDLAGAFLVIAERSDAVRNDAVFAEAERERALVNVMDDVKNCNYVAGSIIRSGPLTLAISTSGAAPAYSVRLRQRFQDEFGPEHGDYLKLLQSLRKPMAYAHPCFKQRRRIWYELVDSDLLDLVRAGDGQAVDAKLAEIAGPAVLDYVQSGHTPDKTHEHVIICDHRCHLPAGVLSCPTDSAETHSAAPDVSHA